MPKPRDEAPPELPGPHYPSYVKTRPDTFSLIMSLLFILLVAGVSVMFGIVIGQGQCEP